MSLASEMASMIDEEGRAVTLRRVAGGAYNPATSSGAVTAVDVTAKALLLEYKDRERDGTQIKAGDRKAVFKGMSAPPKQNDMIIVEEKSFKIIAVRTVEEKGNPVIHSCQIRG